LLTVVILIPLDRRRAVVELPCDVVLQRQVDDALWLYLVERVQCCFGIFGAVLQGRGLCGESAPRWGTIFESDFDGFLTVC
jgi:hypothetical protein